MMEGIDHFCSGNNCIFCRITTTEQIKIHTSHLATINEQLPSRDNSIESRMLYSQGEAGTEQSGESEQLEKLAFYDQLTGLTNVYVFFRELRLEVARAHRYKRPLTILALRLDNFEDIKAKYGPLGRELVLKHIGKLLLSLLRESDLASRLPDDQFAIILPETNEAGAKLVAERIRHSLAKKPVKVNSLVLEITPSIGLATCPKHGQESDTLLESCFTAQAEALNSGGNRVHAL